MQHTLLILLLAAAALLLCAFAPPLLIDSDHNPTLRVHPAVADPAPFEAALATVGAPTALVYDLDGGRTLFAREADTPRPPASLTKLMTALLLLEGGSLDQTVTIQGIDLIGGASMGLQAGEVVTLEQLLWGLLLPSGNDAAMSIGRALAGDPEQFVARMNARAAALNLTATHFESPHGLDRDGQGSSARDLLQIALLNWQVPLFRDIVRSASANVAGHSLINTNELLGPMADNPGVEVIGVKTGTTDAAGQCLIAAFTTQGRVIFVVVMGSADRFTEVKTLYNATTARYEWFAPRAADFAALNRMPLVDGTTHYLTGSGTPPLLLYKWQIPFVHPVRLLHNPDSATWVRGAVVGRIEWRLGAQVLATEQLVVR
jgi:D-alanyl-D-alanine carboxypeptidase